MANFQHTRIIVKIHSHIQREDKGIYDCSADVVQFRSSKTVKGVGGAQFTLLPRRNYLNLLFPNDVVNVYVDPGDGESGFVRTFFGYIDRITRTEVTDENGAMRTGFTVICSDFTKAIDRTQIYFNAFLANRQEFQLPDFGLSQLGGGHALRTKGITAHGTPAQFIENILTLMLGFGTQWRLPRSYPTSNFLQDSRNARRERAKARLPKQIRDELRSVFGVDIEQIGIDDNIELQLLQKQLDTNQNFGVGTTPTALPEQYYQQQAAISDLLNSVVDLQAYQNAALESQKSSSASILDILSLDFIEAMTVDGYITNTSVWTNQGNQALASFLYGWSNEDVNELLFDLRPVVVDADDQCFGTTYSHDEDDLGINVRGTTAMPASVQAVQYVPAVVFREYPYSTVEGLDLSRYYVLGTASGFQAFGPIFASEPNVPGRKLYNYQTAGINALTPEACAFEDSGAPLKHLDVVTIENTDVISAEVGRSDEDLFNFFEVYAGDGALWQYMLNDILPIVTPVSVARHGLRLRQVYTKFANYARDQLCGKDSAGIDNANIRRNLIRWALLIDHWFQHNVEYLTGTVHMRARPDIRVGYRLDWKGRNESYYVEAVEHEWEILKPFTTSVQINRGQRNDPYPVYIPPVMSKMSGLPAGTQSLPNTSDAFGPLNQPAPGLTPVPEFDGGVPVTDQQLSKSQASTVAEMGGGNRTETGRLADFFYVRDTRATSYSVGGSAKYSGQNDIDRFITDGAAEYPNQSANRENNTDQLGDYAIPDQGKDQPT